MKSVAIIGASGVVGSRAVRELCARNDVARVIALGRRPAPIQHDRLTSRVVDLQSQTAIAAELEGADIAISCLGTTMKKAGSQQAFRAVDHDAVLAFGAAARDKGVSRFLIVSGLGAKASSGNFYLRTKGEADDALARLGFPQLTILRPSLIDDDGTRPEARLGERIALPISRALFAIVGKTHRYAPIRADVIARALVRLAFDETTERVRIVESDRLHSVGG
ncbi:MAG TPA: NAD(P)H-binding protein [Polyangiaceae bacterium]|nr:NAD(P)H-binding protein [Polyangiaceae bacterium]